MAFYHGVKSRQNPTALVPTRQISAAIPVAVGCAPIHRLKNQGNAAKNGDVALCYEYSEAAAMLGCSKDDDFERWGLSEAAYSSFIMFATSPAIFINLFDPKVHKAAVIDELVTVKNGVGQLAHEDVIEVTDVTAVTRILLAAEGDQQGLITTENGNPIATEDSTLSVDGAVEGTDFTLNHAKGQMLIADGGTLPQNGQLTVSYTYARPEAVTALDAIGGADYDTGQVTGLQLVDRVFPQFRVVPGIIIAPGFSDDPSVAAIMAVKAGAMNTVFRGVALADLPVEGLANYTRVPAYKNNNNLAQEDLYLCWPRCVFGGRVMRMATQAAGLIGKTDADNNDVPYVSPSNKSLQMQSLTTDGSDQLWLTLEQANYLNENGIATGLNFVGGWKLWGNRTACYPDVTDIKDNFLTNRRMFGWYGNNLTLTWWQKVDDAITRRFVQTIVNSEQITLNTMTANGYILGGRIEFNSEENSTADLMDGITVFHVYLGTASPAEQIHFALEYDPDYLSTLFE
ncbi:phage tail sheath family protein [Klebsiella oxytoca]|uniref:phage tail sheath family protein n=1 Tax=Klebsiella oxytoca TaxID=571 RepID=UPI002245F07B|nr:hypothetical protein [Klebsiella oxytoca]MCW9548014.1 hypothetical protein [Klebsiella oxytoca]